MATTILRVNFHFVWEQLQTVSVSVEVNLVGMRSSIFSLESCLHLRSADLETHSCSKFYLNKMCRRNEQKVVAKKSSMTIMRLPRYKRMIVREASEAATGCLIVLAG